MQSNKKQRQKKIQPNNDQSDNEPQPTDKEQRVESNEKSDDTTSESEPKFEPNFDLAVMKHFGQVLSFVAPLQEKKVVEVANNLVREVEKLQSIEEQLYSLQNPNERKNKK